MTIRKPEPKTAVAMLRAAFKDAGAELRQQHAYDLLARLEGYKNWSHYCAVNKNQPTFGHTPEQVRDWPVWVFFSQYSDEADELLCVMPFGTTAEDVYGRVGPQLPDGTNVPGIILEEDLVQDDAERSRGFVVTEVISRLPRVDRYGIPPYGNDREVAGWCKDELGWSYLVSDTGSPLVETHVFDMGTDNAEQYAVVAHVHPDVHEKLYAMFADE